MHKLSDPAYDLARLFRHGDRAASQPGIRLDFSVNLNPLGIDRSLWRLLALEATTNRTYTEYPDPDCRGLTERLALRHDVPAEAVVVGNGANDLIYATARALRPRRVAIAEPTYTEYLRASLLAGASASHWLAEGDDFRLAPFDPEGADLVWLGNPNNPTGRLLPPGTLAPWVEGHPKTVFVVDEAFLPFRADEAEHSLVPACRRLPNLVALRSMTKVYALAGLRLGYAVACPALAARLREQVVPWSVNAVAQAAGVVTLDNDDYFLLTTRNWLGQNLGPFLAALGTCSDHLRVIPSEANFVLLRLKTVTAGWLCRRLAERGIAVRDASNFVGLDERYVRVALRTPGANARLVADLRQILREG
jgi:histidinol-phosphate/aromatic aminotransferase/cobyric acid decarboxylase-like protein